LKLRAAVSDAPEPPTTTGGIVDDLVAYLVIVVPDPDALSTVVPALITLVEQATIRILDLVVLVRQDDGAVVTLELEAVEALAPLRGVDVEVGAMLSDHDLELVSEALQPGSAGVVLVTEDRWAEPLATAVRTAGGHILGGERIAARRVQAIRAREHEPHEEGPATVT
jgi:hypothetical protein